MAGRAREGWRCGLFCVLALLHSSSLALRPTPLRAAPRSLHRAWAPRAVATVEAAEHPLEAIRAAPAHVDSLESASVAGPLNDAPWRHAFRALAADPAFVSAGFGKAAFKLDERWDFAVGSVTMEDVERDVTLMPPQFVASGVRYQGGIYNQPFTAGFTFADVDARMDEATVVLLNAGFLIPKLAAISLAMLEATRLPIWMNVYLSKPGLTTSTQLHTDTQDVLLIQTTGRKRWRVYRPPPPGRTPTLDSFARGKGTDLLQCDEAELLIDTVMEPGQVLFIPAGFPHTTDTLLEPVEDAIASEPSVHLTVGVDTHLWSLSFAHARQIALDRAGHSPALASGASVRTLDLEKWSLLHAPLPLGFLGGVDSGQPALSAAEREANQASEAALQAARDAMAMEAALEAAEAGAARKAAKQAATSAAKHAKAAAAAAGAAQRASDREVAAGMGALLGARMCAAEPERWAGSEVAQLAQELGLEAAARRLLQHHRSVLAEQTAMYLRATYAPPKSATALRGFTQALMDSMDALDAHTASLEAWAAGAEATGVGAGMGGGSAKGGMGMGMGGPAKAAGKKKKHAAKKKKKR